MMTLRRSFTDEFKREAVALLNTSKNCVLSVDFDTRG